MTALVLVLSAVVAAVAARRGRSRVRARVASPEDRARGTRVGPVRGAASGVGRLFARLGRPLAGALAAACGRAGIDMRPDPFVVGVSTAIALAVLVVAPPLAAPSAVAVPAVAWARARRRRRAHEQALVAELPFVVELFRLALGAGLGVHHAVAAVAARAPARLRPALEGVVARERLGEPLADALGRLLDLGPGLRPMTVALVGAERDGAPAGPGLERAASEARLAHRRRAEEAARRLPVQLLFPLVGCILPAFGLLTVVPLLAASLPHLG